MKHRSLFDTVCISRKQMWKPWKNSVWIYQTVKTFSLKLSDYFIEETNFSTSKLIPKRKHGFFKAIENRWNFLLPLSKSERFQQEKLIHVLSLIRNFTNMPRAQLIVLFFVGLFFFLHLSQSAYGLTIMLCGLHKLVYN